MAVIRYVTSLGITQWRAPITTVECAATQNEIPHDEHEVTVDGFGVFMTQMGWKTKNQLQLIVDPETGKRTLVNITESDAKTLP